MDFSPNSKPLVSIVVPTFNRDFCLFRCLDSLLVQDYPFYELLVIDQTQVISSEKRAYLSERGADLRYLVLDRPNRSLAKNVGIERSRGHVVLFCDDDIVAPPNLVATHAGHYRDVTVGAVSCRIVDEGQRDVQTLDVLRRRFYGRFTNNSHSTLSATVEGLNGGNMSIRKLVLARAGYFEEGFKGTSILEEPDMAYRIRRLGYEIRFDATTTVRHFPQNDGNKATLTFDRAAWLGNYFFNLGMHYGKFRLVFNIPFVLTYTVAAATRNALKHHFKLSQVRRIVEQFLLGIKRGFRVFTGIYTPRRGLRSTVQEMTTVDERTRALPLNDIVVP